MVIRKKYEKEKAGVNKRRNERGEREVLAVMVSYVTVFLVFTKGLS